MTAFSLVINIVIFFLLVNARYFTRKRQEPDYPKKSLAKMALFPIMLGIAFTVLFDIIKGFMFYQLLIFGLVAGFLYWLFYIAGKR
ncbi:MAG: hypothetical protein GXY34_14640 [Syntrophomonadaceae bacterium]|nr:hypothetical protein [Syntrophomonadaceae bacterium]